ncbi:hypothetical protein ABZ532_12135 [Streptomyces sp. NPDC019396]|uniref:hypothetical protein n=1 Tax=Streptomyces sp. NPDC019396 TaxID=3154687 RepID=UPI003410E277
MAVPLAPKAVLQLAAHWREAALELGEFAPPRPASRHRPDTTLVEGAPDPVNLLVTNCTAG